MIVMIYFSVLVIILRCSNRAGEGKVRLTIDNWSNWLGVREWKKREREANKVCEGVEACRQVRGERERERKRERGRQ
jgi:hypothetical protein